MISKKIYILYGTITGNSKSLSKILGKVCKHIGLFHNIYPAKNFNAKKVEKISNVVLIFSTWGHGDPPNNTKLFCEVINTKKVSVKHIYYTIVALGDSIYPEFCGCGRKLDVNLGEAGGKKLLNRIDLDIDYKSNSNVWIRKYVKTFYNKKLLNNDK